MDFTSPNGNLFSLLILGSWPLISIYWFSKTNPAKAIFLCLVGGYLILPEKVYFDFPLVPPLDKNVICGISAFLGIRLGAKSKVVLFPKDLPGRWLLICFVIAPLITFLNNPEPVVRPLGRVISGLSYRDAFSMVVIQYLTLLPMILVFQTIKTYEDQVEIFKLCVIAALIYTLPILFELRMSPQLHSWIYGFFPHSWGQQIRGEGFRPVVFLGHGLQLSIYLSIVFGLITILWRLKIRSNFLNPGIATGYLLVIIILTKGLAALFYSVFFLAVNLVFKPKLINLIALLLATIFVSYPLLKIQDLFPQDQIVKSIESFNPERAQSLEFRFYHEDLLLERAQQKLFFGWGSWGRNRLADSVTDGYWIITLGQFGLVGFGSLAMYFWLLIWRARRVSKYIRSHDQKYHLSGLSVVVSVIMVNQLPNSTMSLFAWFLIGCLAASIVSNTQAPKENTNSI